MLLEIFHSIVPYLSVSGIKAVAKKAHFWIQSIIILILFSLAFSYIYYQNTINSVLFGTSEKQSTVSGKRRSGKSRILPVIVKPVTETPDNTRIEAIGDGRAHKYITIYPESTGEIITMPIAAGQSVNKNDIILRLDTRKAELAIEIAKTKLLEARRKLQRLEKLLKRNVSSKANVDDARTVWNRTRLELEQAQEALKDRTILAPFNGILGIPKVEPGDRVTPSTEIITLDNRSVLTIEFSVPEHYLPKLEIGQTLTARTPGYSEEKFEGKLVAIDSRIDTTSRSIKVRADLPNKKDLLRPGMSFAIQIIIPGPKLPTIPELALQWEQGNSYVWQIRDNKAHKVNVRLVKRVNSNILVKGELKPDDIVVIEGVQRLRSGSKVKYTPPAKRRQKSIKQAKG